MYPKKGLWLGVLLFIKWNKVQEVRKALWKEKKKGKIQIPCLKLRNLKTSHFCSCF